MSIPPDVDCRGLRAIVNGDIVFINSTTYGSLAEVTCHTGYELVGNVSVCLASGDWDGEPPICRGEHMTLSHRPHCIVHM